MHINQANRNISLIPTGCPQRGEELPSPRLPLIELMEQFSNNEHLDEWARKNGVGDHVRLQARELVSRLNDTKASAKDRGLAAIEAAQLYSGLREAFLDATDMRAWLEQTEPHLGRAVLDITETAWAKGDDKLNLSGWALASFSSEKLKNLPSGMGALYWVRELDLRNNELTSIPALEGMEGLTHLYLSINDLGIHVDDDGNPSSGQGFDRLDFLRNLELLDLSANGLTGKYHLFADCLANLARLRTLDLSDNDLATTPEFALRFPAFSDAALTYSPESEDCSTPVVVALSNNRIQDVRDSHVALVEASEPGRYSHVFFDLTDNPLSDDCQASLDQLIQTRMISSSAISYLPYESSDDSDSDSYNPDLITPNYNPDLITSEQRDRARALLAPYSDVLDNGAADSTLQGEGRTDEHGFLETFVGRLRDTKEAQNGGLAALEQRFQRVLDAARNDPDLYTIVRETAQKYLGTCVDAIALGLDDMEVAVEMHRLPTAGALDELARIIELSDQAFHLDQLDAIAKEEAKKKGLEREELEFVLAYRVLAREIANETPPRFIPGVTQQMQFGSNKFGFNKNLVYRKIRTIQAEEEAMISFMENFGPFRARQEHFFQSIPPEIRKLAAAGGTQTPMLKHLREEASAAAAKASAKEDEGKIDRGTNKRKASESDDLSSGKHRRTEDEGPRSDIERTRRHRIAEFVRTPGQWNSNIGDFFVSWIVEVPGWPAGRALTVESRGNTYTYEPPGGASGAAIQIIHVDDGVEDGQRHYMARVPDEAGGWQDIDVPAAGDCFFEAVALAMGARDLATFIRGLRLPEPSSIALEVPYEVIAMRLGMAAWIESWTPDQQAMYFAYGLREPEPQEESAATAGYSGLGSGSA